MQFIISKEIFEKHPEYVCGVVIARDISNQGASEEIIQMIKAEEEKIKRDFNLEDLALHPFIQNWRKVYSSFGSKPAEFRASSEALIRRTLKGDNVSHINRLVDIYNYISLKYRTPVGGEDIDKINENLYLQVSDGTEKFIPLGSNENDNPYAGEIIYVDDSKNVLCRRWNWRESDLTKLTEDTKNSILVVEVLPPVTMDSVKSAVEELAILVKRFCNSETSIFILSKDNQQIEF